MSNKLKQALETKKQELIEEEARLSTELQKVKGDLKIIGKHQRYMFETHFRNTAKDMLTPEQYQAIARVAEEKAASCKSKDHQQQH